MNDDFDRAVKHLLTLQERDPELAALMMPVVAGAVRHDRYQAALEQIRDHGPEEAARIAEAALLPAETSGA